MAILEKLQTDYIRFMSSLLRDEFLESQFFKLQKLQNEIRVKMLSHYFNQAEEHLNSLTMALQQQVVDFEKLDNEVHQFKDYSFSIGVLKVKGVLNAFRVSCHETSLDGCRECLQLAKARYILVKKKLETLCRLEQRIVVAGGSIPIISSVLIT